MKKISTQIKIWVEIFLISKIDTFWFRVCVYQIPRSWDECDARSILISKIDTFWFRVCVYQIPRSWDECDARSIF